MANKSTFNLPFSEAETFFKAKLNISTDKWNDLWQEQHAKGFMVAGATKADLLTDFNAAINKSIAGGMTLKEFQAQFDTIVAKHGWSYNGNRNWRSALIYDTNVTTAYQAGRWQQFRESGASHLMYWHADGVMNPRPQHVAMHGTVRPIGDPFWSTHYPPNGWGCKCRAVIARAAEQTEVPAAAADPKTIDPGWAYNVGEAGEAKGYAPLLEKFETLPPETARQWINSFVREPAFERFFSGKVEGIFPVAVLSVEQKPLLSASQQTVWLSQDGLLKNQGKLDRSKGHPELTLDEYRLLPQVIGDAPLIIRKAGERWVFTENAGQIYLAVVRAAGDDKNYMLSFRRSSVKDVLREMKHGEVVKNDLGW